VVDEIIRLVNHTRFFSLPDSISNQRGILLMTVLRKSVRAVCGTLKSEICILL
jgi:hypothetical protein